jgi:hypothetical protein
MREGIVKTASVATSKAKLFAYVTHRDKADLERLADLRNRSVSNLIETLVKEEIARAKAAGELPNEQ